MHQAEQEQCCSTGKDELAAKGDHSTGSAFTTPAPGNGDSKGWPWTGLNWGSWTTSRAGEELGKWDRAMTKCSGSLWDSLRELSQGHSHFTTASPDQNSWKGLYLPAATLLHSTSFLVQDKEHAQALLALPVGQNTSLHCPTTSSGVKHGFRELLCLIC